MNCLKKTNPLNERVCLNSEVENAGFEPAASTLPAWRSSQLS